jgi:hypothetical protein
MQPLAFLWFEMQMTQQYLREKTFGPAPSPANSANLNTAIVQEVLRRGARVLRAVRKPIVRWRRRNCCLEKAESANMPTHSSPWFRKAADRSRRKSTSYCVTGLRPSVRTIPT